MDNERHKDLVELFEVEVVPLDLDIKHIYSFVLGWALAKGCTPKEADEFAEGYD